VEQLVDVTAVEAVGGFRLGLTFDDGTTTIFEGTNAGPRPAAASAATPAI
jgi:hypothetical protein